jgi:hypothetical protein
MILSLDTLFVSTIKAAPSIERPTHPPPISTTDTPYNPKKRSENARNEPSERFEMYHSA